jgi:hypothetical protein
MLLEMEMPDVAGARVSKEDQEEFKRLLISIRHKLRKESVP